MARNWGWRVWSAGLARQPTEGSRHRQPLKCGRLGSAATRARALGYRPAPRQL